MGSWGSIQAAALSCVAVWLCLRGVWVPVGMCSLKRPYPPQTIFSLFPIPQPPSSEHNHLTSPPAISPPPQFIFSHKQIITTELNPAIVNLTTLRRFLRRGSRPYAMETTGHSRPTFDSPNSSVRFFFF